MVFPKGHKPWNTGNRGICKKHGYILVYCPEHPNCMTDGYIYQHRLVMEKHLGRYLTKKEHIHHINGNTEDNRLENLQLTTHSKHAKIHKTTHGLSKTKEYLKISNQLKYKYKRDYIKKQRVRDILLDIAKSEQEACGDCEGYDVKLKNTIAYFKLKELGLEE